MVTSVRVQGLPQVQCRSPSAGQGPQGPAWHTYNRNSSSTWCQTHGLVMLTPVRLQGFAQGQCRSPSSGQGPQGPAWHTYKRNSSSAMCP
jgi:hypothetical protein